MPSLHFSYKCSKFKCQSMRFLGTKLLDDFVGVDGPVSVNVQESKTRQPLCSHGTPHIGLNPPHSTEKTLRGCYRQGHRDKDGEDGRNIIV